MENTIVKFLKQKILILIPYDVIIEKKIEFFKKGMRQLILHI